jgi:hypothetical protein
MSGRSYGRMQYKWYFEVHITQSDIRCEKLFENYYMNSSVKWMLSLIKSLLWTQNNGVLTKCKVDITKGFHNAYIHALRSTHKINSELKFLCCFFVTFYSKQSSGKGSAVK